MVAKDQSTRTKQILTLVAIVLAIITVCISVSFVTRHWFSKSQDAWNHDMTHGHQWLHETLNLTEKEEAAIDAFEGDYRSERERLVKEFDSRVGDLRQILVSTDQYVPEVDAAIHRLHEVHGELQELSIQHYYDMLNVLPPEKQDKLRQLAVKALSQPE
ncbi:periplasmic heavy metal sensor [Coraliomargarita sp. SDUM461004]|uniref:Periplasmic heavy metal sensor n=1 Tax=Thalassobacterium sedimentorum TaxID=3041258 RepID=A0ABU1AN77_9BACT|nr:periplasmic heavy metal sensor [Coraliomargarita sp. SDUM461004]MDQ8195310.1 periplasmic heavy metal sensor [Coraliomargarita sp. SDUM461004]